MFICKKLFKLQIRSPNLIVFITTTQERRIFPSQSWEVRNSIIIIIIISYSLRFLRLKEVEFRISLNLWISVCIVVTEVSYGSSVLRFWAVPHYRRNCPRKSRVKWHQNLYGIRILQKDIRSEKSNHSLKVITHKIGTAVRSKNAVLWNVTPCGYIIQCIWPGSSVRTTDRNIKNDTI